MILEQPLRSAGRHRRGRERFTTYPVDQISTALPWPFLLRTSGATYPKLPASECSCSSEECRCFALQSGGQEGASGNKQTRAYMPKSAITISECSSFVRYRMFSGLTLLSDESTREPRDYSLEIAMHDVVVVKILNTFQYGSTIEASVLCTVPTHKTKKVYGSPNVNRR